MKRLNTIVALLPVRPSALVVALLLAAANPLLAPLALAAEEQTWTVNFRDVEIEELIRFVADATGKTIIVDPAVQGSVQVLSNKAVNQAELYELFLSILEVHGFAAVSAGDVVRVVPAVAAREQALPVNLNQNTGGGSTVMTQVIQVNNVSAEQLVPILRPLAAEEAQMTAYAASNSIIVTDSAANIDRIRTMVQFMDRSSVKQNQIVALNNASAEEVVSLLQKLRGGEGAPATAPLQIVADKRTNSVLLSGEQAQIQQYQALIKQLDSPLTQDGNVNVINLQYARAEELAPLLNGILRNVQTTSATGATEGAAPAPAASNNDASVEADSATNSLIITANAETLQTIKNVIARLDIRKAQVLVEAIIVELSGERGQDLGVQWLFQNDNGAYGSSSTGSPTSAAIAGAALGGVDANGNPVDIRGSLARALTSTPGQLLGVGRLDAELSFNVLISALQAEKSANILSTPSLLTLDNEEAVITVGRNVPFVTGSFTSTGNVSNPTNPFQTVERQNVGVTLKVVPHINEGDSLVLELSQEVSSLLGAGSVLLNGNPITNERKIQTTVLADDGQTVILGGLMEDSLNSSQQKVPLLGDIPGLGRLFRSSSNAVTKTHLLVFLRASIMRENREMSDATAAKYRAIRNEQIANSPDVPTIPVLPEWQAEIERLQQQGVQAAPPSSTPTPSP